MLDISNIDSTKVYSLVRVSSDKQDFDSQMEGITNWCRNNNITLYKDNIIEAYNVSGYKTKLKDRNDLIQIEQLVHENKIDMLIVFNQDRIGRRTELISFFNMLTDNNVLVVSVTEGILNDTSNSAFDLISMVKFWTSKEESKKISQRTKSGKLATSKQGKYNGGKVLLGYKVVNGKLVIDKDMEHIIKGMYNNYIQGGSKLALEYLANNGIKKVHQTLLQLIKNPTYKGYMQHDKKYYNKEDYKEIMTYNKELQIVSNEVWQQANDKIQANRTNLKGKTTRTNRTDIKIESLCYCSKCGSKLTLQKDYRYEPTRYILQCRKCKTNKATSQKNWSLNKLEEIIDSKLNDILAYEIDRNKLEDRYNSNKNINIQELEQQIQYKEQQLKDKKKAIINAKAKLELLLTNDNMTIDMIEVVSNTINNITKEANELEQDIQELKQQIEQQRLSNANDRNKIDTLLKLKDLYYLADSKQQKQLIQMLVKKIEVSNDYNYNVKIYLNY